ncbi:MAG: alpha/beta hydrolase, partial [Chloroflexi bacterium]|nr:alpha/beta hydrolase [Chloroflexota bacterium]
MSSDDDSKEGLPMHEAARRMRVPFKGDVSPEDKTIKVNGLDLHYLDWGEPKSPLIVTLHGFAQSCHSWDFTSLSLCDRYRVVSLDQRGHGDSEWAPDENYSTEAYVSDLGGLVDGLKLDKPVIVGLSMGGRNGFVYAAQHPEKIRGLVIVEAAPTWGREGSEKVRKFVETVDDLDSPDDYVPYLLEIYPMRKPEQLRGSVRRNLKQLPNGKWTWKYDKALRMPGAQKRGTPEETARLWRLLESLEVPTLVIRGSGSDTISAEGAEEMAERIPGARLAGVP